MRAIFLDIDGVICCNQFGRLEDRKLRTPIPQSNLVALKQPDSQSRDPPTPKNLVCTF